jgi:hypothetical protein
MVFAVRCPAIKCRKYMLVEETSRGKTIPCLICKSPISIPPNVPAVTPVAVNPEPAPQPAPALPQAVPISGTSSVDSDFELIPDDRP